MTESSKKDLIENYKEDKNVFNETAAEEKFTNAVLYFIMGTFFGLFLAVLLAFAIAKY